MEAKEDIYILIGYWSKQKLPMLINLMDSVTYVLITPVYKVSEWKTGLEKSCL